MQLQEVHLYRLIGMNTPNTTNKIFLLFLFVLFMKKADPITRGGG